jgi:hypothetical protein
MAKLKIPCPHCDQPLQCDERYRGRKVKCPHCKHSLRVPPAVSQPPVAPPKRSRTKWKRKRKLFLAASVFVLVLLAVVRLWLLPSTTIHWPDRRPIGALFLASHYHSSATNPRGWFNDPALNFTGTNGPARFRQALMEYTDRSLEILKRTGAQGVIVWDLEGEQYPHKISFIGDPRLLDRLAPEMAPVVDEFFARLRNAGLRVGVTVRPQQLEFGRHGSDQAGVVNIKQSLLEKIDFARTHWGATLFYVDSNGGIRRPDEVMQMRSLAAQRPDILLIPEHHYLPYAAFSAPYISMRQTERAAAGWKRKLFPGSFQAIDISDSANNLTRIEAARSRGDILLFRAWTWTPECRLLEDFAQAQK